MLPSAGPSNLSTTTTFRPLRARCYAQVAPRAPAPTITMSACTLPIQASCPGFRSCWHDARFRSAARLRRAGGNIGSRFRQVFSSAMNSTVDGNWAFACRRRRGARSPRSADPEDQASTSLSGPPTSTWVTAGWCQLRTAASPVPGERPGHQRPCGRPAACLRRSDRDWFPDRGA
jgi:hypothetical protein